MRIDELVTTARDAITVKRVYGEVYEKDGVTFVPAAIVAGGAGGGGGQDERRQAGEGGGFGVVGRPAGAYVVKDGDVTWRPAVDVNRLLAVLGLVAAAYLLSRPRVIRARARAARAAGEHR